MAKPILTTSSFFELYRLHLTRPLHLTDRDFHFVTIDPRKLHRWPMTGEVLFFRPGPKMLSLLTVLFLTKLLIFTQAWTVPQSRANVWALLAEFMGQNHICLSQASASDPMSTCLMGIPFKQWEIPERLLHCAHCISKTPQFNPFIGWRNFVLSLPNMREEPRELWLLGATAAPACIRLTNLADALDNRTKHVFQSKVLDRAHSWCKKLAKGVLPVALVFLRFLKAFYLLVRWSQFFSYCCDIKGQSFTFSRFGT
ncbi:uncharacterized protein LOC134565206 [Prinia subflava]|uniref:uncharacterized protein LOC134565206 n=1 Tax=Prinia subflava TaxID=208062 RepID=UPI002FE053B2